MYDIYTTAIFNAVFGNNNDSERYITLNKHRKVSKEHISRAFTKRTSSKAYVCKT